MSTVDHKQNGRKIFSLFRRAEQWVEISGYRVGDIPLDEPVFVARGANIVGNIIAPKIRVAGLIYGSTTALETIIDAEGEIWGDVYTAHLNIESGGKIQGWVSSIDESSYQAIRSEGTIPEIDPNPGPFEIPTNGRSLERSSTQIDLLRRLQAEAATAISARAELEQSFDKRLQEVAGEASAKVISLTEKLKNAEKKIAQFQQTQEKQEEETRHRIAQVERQNNELSVARQLLAERNQELETLHRQHADLLDAKQKLEAAKVRLENDLLEIRTANDQLTARLNGLETALQANLQHSAEQEDALIRWQELAETTQKRTKELEDELKRIKFQFEENQRVTEMVQVQRRELEDELETAMDKLDALQHRETQPLAANAEDMQRLLAHIETLETNQERMTELEEQASRIPELEEQLSEMARLSEQVQELSQAKAQIAALEDEAQDRSEQLLWYKANLETSRREIDTIRQQMAGQKAWADDITTQLYEQQVATKQWQQTAGQTSKELQERDKTLSAMQKKLVLVQQQGNLEQKQLREEARRFQLQLEAHEQELSRYLDEIKKQSSRLAEVHATLVDRDIELQELKEAYANQSQTLQQFKQVAGDRIKRLQVDLTKTKRQLEDLTAVLERRQRRTPQ